MQKEIRTKINQESTISWEKFCNSINLESDPKNHGRRRQSFLTLKAPIVILWLNWQQDCQEKDQLFVEGVERNFGTESHLFRKSHFDRINKLAEARLYHFTPLDSLHDNVTDTDDNSDLVADVDPETLIRIV